MKLDKPNYTQLPNVILDGMATLSDAELRVVLYVCRMTFGWRRDQAKITLKDIVKATGKSKSSIAPAVTNLEAMGTIKRKSLGPGFGFVYLMVYEENEPVQKTIPPLSHTPDAPVQVTTPPPVHVPDTQYKERVKEKEGEPPKPEPESIPSKAERLCKLFATAYAEVYGDGYPTVNKWKDFDKAKLIVETMEPEAVIAVVKKAWQQKKGWNCLNKTSTLHEAVTCMAQIKTEIRQNETSKGNSRLNGQSDNPTAKSASLAAALAASED